MDKADIIVFLFSPNFIASSECMAEWDRAKSLSEHRGFLFRIPIILAPCAWIDLLQDDLVKALPDDGKPVSGFTDNAAAWQQVYKGIKRVVENLRNAVCPRDSFITAISRTDFIFGNTSMLLDTYIFPTLTHHHLKQTAKSEFRPKLIDQEQLLQKQYTIVYGDDVSGKTALLRYLFLTLSQNYRKHESPLLIDLKNVSGQSNEDIVKSCYRDQYIGDYDLWKCQSQNIAIVDNLFSDRKHVQFMEYAKKRFSRVIVTVSSHIYQSYFFDDSRFAEFYAVEIRPLNHYQQEQLIRKVLPLSQGTSVFPDGLVDRVEDKINSVIISNRIVPRYPFYVLSILQSEEKFMPEVSFTSFGHCYYILGYVLISTKSSVKTMVCRNAPPSGRLTKNLCVQTLAALTSTCPNHRAFGEVRSVAER